MCHPAIPAVIMAIAAAGSTAASIHSNNQQAKAAVDAANKAADADYAALEQQQREGMDAAAVERMERIRQGLRERAALRVNSGEAGLAGVTPALTQETSLFQEGYDLSIIEQNKNNRLLQGARTANSIRATNEGRLGEARSRMTSGTMAALQIGLAGTSGAMQGYSMGTQMKRSGG